MAKESELSHKLEGIISEKRALSINLNDHFRDKLIGILGRDGFALISIYNAPRDRYLVDKFLQQVRAGYSRSNKGEKLQCHTVTPKPWRFRDRPESSSLKVLILTSSKAEMFGIKSSNS